ncbi:MAG: hypothetical protein QNJ30_27155 [Kiloniellales bacterium]|nr:hypothetical protein [Kiloniellales bacterium]
MEFPRDYNAAVDFVDRHLAEGRAGKLAFVDPERALTYGELAAAAATSTFATMSGPSTRWRARSRS